MLSMTACKDSIRYDLNLGFENVDSSGYLSGWMFTKPNTGYLIKRDTQIFQAGKASISIEHLYGSYGGGACTYEFSAPLKGTEIQLTGYIKSNNVQNGYGGLWMRIEDSDQKILCFKNMKDAAIVGTKDWRKYTIKLPLNPIAAEKIYFGGLLVGTGKIWIDNLQLTVDGHNIASLPLKKLKNADLDKSFIRSSGVDHIVLDTQRIRNLTNLGMIWGFVKYYHSRIASGDINWDAELFRILPKILSCKSGDDANVVLEKWLNALGEPALSPNPDTIESSHIRMDADYGFLFSPNNLSSPLIDKLKKWRDYHVAIEDHYYLSLASGVGNPVFKHEFSPGGDLYPDEGYRLLALFRYWNIVNYFYPYRYNIEGNWNETLAEFIPKVLNASDKVEYAKVCLELICKINDGHAVVNGNSSLDSVMGRFTAPFEANFIGSELVVTRLLGDDSINNNIKVGDPIKAIDGKSINALIQQYIHLTPGANLQNKMFKLASNPGWILRSGNQSMDLMVMRKNKEVRVTLQKMPLSLYYSNYWIYSKDEQSKRGYYLINNNIGYIYPASLKDKDIDTIKEIFKGTKGIIVDLRCYPRTFMPYEYGKWLKEISSPFAIFTKPWLTRPGTFIYGNTARNGLVDTSYTNGRIDFISTYRGKLIVLVNELTISQAEFTTMALQSIPGTIALGSQTAGSDGDVSRIVLPGDIYTMISGLGVYYPDSSETQCIGVKINQVVKPTIVGISEERDELLERAIRYF